jgi:hypothetical protein
MQQRFADQGLPSRFRANGTSAKVDGSSPIAFSAGSFANAALARRAQRHSLLHADVDFRMSFLQRR